jgi:hypothetical protein
MTRSLQAMRHWPLGRGVTIAAMESPSAFWKAPFYCLGEVMTTWLLNAAHIEAVPGRATDVRDAEWIAQLLEHGLPSPSFVPPPEIRRSRMLTRYRVQLKGIHSGHHPVGADAGDAGAEVVLGAISAVEKTFSSGASSVSRTPSRSSRVRPILTDARVMGSVSRSRMSSS